MKSGICAGFMAVIVFTVSICGIAAAQEMSVDEIGSVVAGERITISGTTNLAPGDRLLVTVAPIGFWPGNRSVPAAGGGAAGTAVVEEGNATWNTWSFEIDTTGFEPGDYSVVVEWVEGDASASTTFSVIEAAEATAILETTAAPTTLPTMTPDMATSTTATAGAAFPFSAFIAAGVAVLLMRR